MSPRPQFASSSSTSLCASLCVLVLSLAWSESSVAQSDETQVDISWGQKIAMRDGVKLNATVYKPRSITALPVIFTLTPYISDTYHDRAWFFSKNEYVYVLVDARGRGNSEGKFTPFLQEAKDGHDIVQWLARQSWCDGQVAMWGGSYAGYDQWATAKEFPPNLVTIVPAAAAFPGVDFPMRRNIPYQYDIQWATLTSGVTPNMKLFQQREYWAQVYSRMYNEHLPFKDLPGLAGNLTTDFATWVSHPRQDEFWDAMNPTDDEFARINLPILTITGHYDGDQLGALEFYKRHMQFAPEEAKQKHYLIMGPWDHAGTRTPAQEVGGLDLGEASLVDLNQLHKEWYDWTMKKGKKPEFLKQRIAYYVTGSDDWEYSSSLASIAPNNRTLYLSSTDGLAHDVFRSGLLLDEAPESGVVPDRYVYDPLDNRPDNIDTYLANYVTDFPSPASSNHAGVIALPHLGASTLEAEENCASMVAACSARKSRARRLPKKTARI